MLRSLIILGALTFTAAAHAQRPDLDTGAGLPAIADDGATVLLVEGSAPYVLQDFSGVAAYPTDRARADAVVRRGTWAPLAPAVVVDGAVAVGLWARVRFTRGELWLESPHAAPIERALVPSPRTSSDCDHRRALTRAWFDARHDVLLVELGAAECPPEHRLLHVGDFAVTRPFFSLLAETPPLNTSWWFASWVWSSGFPAVSEDGKLVIFESTGGGGSSDRSNRSIIAMAVDSGKRVFEARLLTMDVDAANPLRAPLPARDRMIYERAFAKTQAFLAKRRWRTLEGVDAGGEPGPTVAIADVLVRFVEPRLSVQSVNGRFDRDFASWSGTWDYSACGPDVRDRDPSCACHNTTHLAYVWRDAARDVLLVSTAQQGSDQCPEDVPIVTAMRVPQRAGGGWKANAERLHAPAE